MIVKRFSFEGFRNLNKNEIFPDSRMNVIYGDNAQGKTNFIEGIWMFTGAKSFRGSKDSELIGFGEKSARIDIDFFAEERNQSASISIGDKRKASLNGIEKKSASELCGSFNAVIFSPLHIKLVEEGPEGRRKFLDTAIGQIYPKYADLLRRYSRAVMQRNKALRDVKFHPDIYDLIDIFENSIAAFGGRIVRYRLRYIAALLKSAPQIYAGISGEREALSFHYAAKGFEPSENETDNANQLLQLLRNNRDDDILAGNTSAGPHRDDMDIFIDSHPVRSFASQGQKRSTVLSLKLAEAQMLKASTGEQPIALLDDVMSELDINRQNYILNHINDWQVFLTCCDPSPLKNLFNGKVFYMENGILKEESEL